MDNSSFPSQTAEAATAATALKATVGGAATGVFGWIVQNNVLTLIGVLVAVLGFLVNAYFKRRDTKRMEKLARLRMELMQKHNDRAEELHKLKVDFLKQPAAANESDLARLLGIDSSDFEDVYKDTNLR